MNRQPFVNMVVTNVPGPDVPLYVLGARMLEVIPLVPLGGNLSVGVAALSYNGLFTIGVLVDPNACPDADILAGESAVPSPDSSPGTTRSPGWRSPVRTLPPIVRHRQGHLASPGTCP